MQQRISKKRLVSLALQWAIDDRLSYAMCDRGPEGERAQALVKEFRALLNQQPTERSKDELMCLAFVYAQQDREGYADGDRSDDGKRAAEWAKRFRDYRRATYGRTKMEAIEEQGQSAVNVVNLLRQGK